MRRWRGYILVAGAATCWGCAATFVKHLLNHHYDPFIIIQTRVTFSFILLICFFLITHRSILRISLKDLPLAAFVGICGIAGSNYFYYYAIQESTVAAAILIQYTAPVMVALYATIVQKEHFPLTKGLAIALSVAGIFFAVGGYDAASMQATPKAILFAFIAAVAYSIFNIAGKSLIRKYRTWTTLTISLGFASLFWGVLNTPGEILSAGYSIGDWMNFLLVSLISILLPYSLYFSGLKILQPTQAIITSTLEPIVAIVSESLFLGILIGLPQLGGAIGVLAAIYVLQIPDRQQITAPLDGIHP
jgi:drug/metabolite transporter (DMT)-like permease